MIRNSIYPYYWFGTALRYLQDAKEGYLLGDIADPENGYTLYNLQAFFDYLDLLNLHVTKRASYQLSTFFKELKLLPTDTRLSGEQAVKLRKFITEIRPTLEAEIKGFEAYVVMPKRLDIVKLVNDVPSLLSPNTFEKLPLIAKHDLEEAGKCIASERSTAAAFHLLRGTECVLKEFYCTMIKQKRSQLMWGPIVLDLRKRPKTKKYDVMINNLDNIRRSFRNPTQHLEKIYDIQEVQDLWGLCIEAINRMVKEMP
ncbi:MAG: hypothetical protein IH589_14465 [Anaerolineales bacterium]|nr:hypothetical protein [Anaerolineales bacterium]